LGKRGPPGKRCPLGKRIPPEKRGLLREVKSAAGGAARKKKGEWRARASEPPPPAQGAAAVEILQDLPVHRHPENPLLPRIWQLCQNLTAYDATYVALAEALDCPLLTFDAGLSRVPSLQVTVLPGYEDYTQRVRYRLVPGACARQAAEAPFFPMAASYKSFVWDPRGSLLACRAAFMHLPGFRGHER